MLNVFLKQKMSFLQTFLPRNETKSFKKIIIKIQQNAEHEKDFLFLIKTILILI